MYQPAVCLQGKAARTGFEIIFIDQSERIASRKYLEAGPHVWTEKAGTDYRLLSRTDEAEQATVSILNAKTDRELGAFTSRYGHLAHPRLHLGGECVSLEELRRVVGDLRRLYDLLLAGDFTEANPLPNGMVMSPFSVAFNLWLVPDESSPNFSVQFMTYSLYTFLVHELITRALGNRPLLVCAYCRDYQRAARRDRLFCSGRCRTAHSRLVHDKQITPNLPARPEMPR